MRLPARTARLTPAAPPPPARPGPPTRRVAATSFLGAVILASCSEPWPEPPAIDAELLQSEHAEWREYRQGRLVEPPGGAVLWIGLFDLPEGETAFGSDPALPIALPADDAPPLLGTLVRAGASVTLRPRAGAPLRLEDGTPIEAPIELGHDRLDHVVPFHVGSLGMRVHAEPGTDRLWLRVWDTDHPERETFELPPYFPVEEEWVVTARFDPYDDVRILRVPDVTGGLVEYQARGELVFRKEDREHRLIATATDRSTRYFVMLWDSTAVSETYQGGRYLQVDFPDESGWTTIDFNRTYNAPCVFTDFSVCALPPRENWLGLAVTAGEKRPDAQAGWVGAPSGS